MAKITSPIILDSTAQEIVSKLAEINETLKQGGGDAKLTELYATENREYYPEPGWDGFNKVTVDVSGGGSGISFDSIMNADKPNINVPEEWVVPSNITKVSMYPLSFQDESKEQLTRVKLTDNHPGLTVGKYGFYRFSNLSTLDFDISLNDEQSVEESAFQYTKVLNPRFKDNVKLLKQNCFSGINVDQTSTPEQMFSCEQITNESYESHWGVPYWFEKGQTDDKVFVNSRPDVETGGEEPTGDKPKLYTTDSAGDVQEYQGDTWSFSGDKGDNRHTIENNGRWYNYRYNGEKVHGGITYYEYECIRTEEEEEIKDPRTILLERMHDGVYKEEEEEEEKDHIGYYWVFKDSKDEDKDENKDDQPSNDTKKYGYREQPQLLNEDGSDYTGDKWGFKYEEYQGESYHFIYYKDDQQETFDGIEFKEESGAEEGEENHQFADCNVRGYNLPNLVKISKWMFAYNYNVTELAFDNVIYVATGAFSMCSSLSRLSLKRCECFNCSSSLDDCPITEIDFSLASKVVKLKNAESFPTPSTAEGITVKVPAQLEQEFRDDPEWQKILDKINLQGV